MTKEQISANIEIKYRSDIEKYKKSVFWLIQDSINRGVSHFPLSRVRGHFSEIVQTMAMKELPDLRFQKDGGTWE